MLTGKEFVEDFLAHAGNYDPVKAREYYLRTRKLKGRKTGRTDDTSGAPSGGRGPTSEANLVNLNQKQKEATAARVGEIKARLTKLEAVLSKLLADAGSESSSSSSSSPSKSKSSSSDKSTPDKPLTAKQKSDARDRAKKSYDKNKKDTPTEQASVSKEARIAKVREQIRTTKDQLKKAIESSRQMQASASAQPTSLTARGR